MEHLFFVHTAAKKSDRSAACASVVSISCSAGNGGDFMITHFVAFCLSSFFGVVAMCVCA